MKRAERDKYGDPEALKDILHRTLYKKKFRLECGHYITFGAVLGNDLIIRNGKDFTVICSQCGY